MYMTWHEPMLAFMGMQKAILYNTCGIYTPPIIKTPTCSVQYKSESANDTPRAWLCARSRRTVRVSDSLIFGHELAMGRNKGHRNLEERLPSSQRSQADLLGVKTPREKSTCCTHDWDERRADPTMRENKILQHTYSCLRRAQVYP